MGVIVVGGGIGGLVTALMLHRKGIDCDVYEQSAEIRELGVGINTLPHAIRELTELGLLAELDAVAIRTHELFYLNRFGQEVWREPRGLHAGHEAPQFSIHRGRLQAVVFDAVVARLGRDRIHTDRRLQSFTADDDAVSAIFVDAAGVSEEVHGDILVGADGIHSTVRRTLHPDEGAPRWNGLMLWRGATDWPSFLDGFSMVIAGGLEGKIVVYPIAEGTNDARRLTNWAVIGKVGAPGAPPERQDWSQVATWTELRPFCEGIRVPQTDVHALMQATPTFWRYPMCDRDPLPFWSRGRVTLLGDAAHPLYPVGSNGASQAIIDARTLADCLAKTSDPAAALRAYEAERLPMTADIARANRSGGPEGVIDAVEALAPDGFTDIDTVLSHADRKAIVRGYARMAGFDAASAAGTSTTGP